MNPRVLQNQARYDHMAAFYPWLVRFGSLGQFPRFYRAVADAIEVAPGALLLDMGCGPGTLAPYLLPKVGSEGTVHGVDVSGEMIDRARALSQRNGWPNVRFERSDARDFAPGRAPAIVVFCLSLSTMPDPGSCFARALSWLEPGGQLVVLDSFLDPARRLASLAIRLKSPLVGADPAAISLAEVRAGLESVRVEHLQGGVYTLVSGRKPADASRRSGAAPGYSDATTAALPSKYARYFGHAYIAIWRPRIRPCSLSARMW
jgi:ubiquinone/menaquinone biosynthesis C-methylase UbiE